MRGLSPGTAPGPGCQYAVKIRSHLLLLVAGAVMPLLVFATALTAYSWWQQRNALEVRQLERARAMTIALDTELQASMRVLRVLGLSPSLDPARLDAFAERMRGVLSTQPLWSVLAVGDPAWSTVVAVSPKPALSKRPVLDEAMRRRVLETRLPAVSGLVRSDDGFFTQIAVPVIAGDGVRMIVMAAIEQQAWLGFMSQYPMGTGAIMTLIDPDGRIIARTLNNDRWVGRPPSPELLERSREVAEAAFRNVGLEGVALYSAHSRSVRWGWTVATGIPAKSVEEALRESSLLLIGAAALTVALAVVLALLFGRRIERPVAALGRSARALAHGDGDASPATEARSIDEVREVAHAFEEAGAMLHERQRALNDALAGEQAARREAEQASAAKDEFLAMLGHELRNPLSALGSAVAVLDHVEPQGPEAARAKGIVHRQIASLRELVDELLDVARVTRGKITLHRGPVDFGRLAGRAVAVMSATGRLGMHELRVDCGEAWVDGDETRLEQVVTNLLENAAKYTPQGGRIDVRVHPDGADAVLEVEDTGVGMSPELLPRVFDLFSQGERTLDRSQGGLGVGLALVRRLVELHGGRVSARSDGPGRGACFSVRLPREQAPARALARPRAQAEADKKLRILIVEDNADGRETLAMMLSLQGHEVHEAENGPSGVDRALELHPDAAIVDIGLPGFDGYEVARRIRKAAKGAAIRLIALTGYGQDEDRRNALAAGFDCFMVKPADMKALSSFLATV